MQLLAKFKKFCTWGSQATVPFLKYEYLKLNLRVFLAGHTVAMVTYSVMKVITTCLPIIGQIFDTIIVASIDNEW